MLNIAGLLDGAEDVERYCLVSIRHYGSIIQEML